MFENIIKFFKNIGKSNKEAGNSKEAAKERLHLVLMQDRANVSADFLDLMKQEIIEVIKKYIDVDENEIDVRLANKTNEDGTTGAPALYANIPIISIKEEARKEKKNIQTSTSSCPEPKEEKEEKKKEDTERALNVSSEENKRKQEIVKNEESKETGKEEKEKEEVAKVETKKEEKEEKVENN